MIYNFLITLLSICLGNTGQQVEKTEKPEGEKMQKTDYYIRKCNPKTGIEVYDKETFKNNSKGNSALLKTKDGWTILMGNITESGAIVYEYPPLPNSYITQKIFYPNGKLKQVCSYYQEKLMVGISKYYDEEGNLIKEVNEDNKYKHANVTLSDVLKLLEKKEWIDLKTGKGLTEISITDNIITITPPVFNIQFLEGETNIWSIEIFQKNNRSLFYDINATTGEIKEEEIQFQGIE